MSENERRSVSIFVTTAIIFAVSYGVFMLAFFFDNDGKQKGYLEYNQRLTERFESDKAKVKILKAIAVRDEKWPTILALHDLLANANSDQRGIDGIISWAESVNKMSKEERATFRQTPEWKNIQRLADDQILPFLVELRNGKMLTPALAGNVNFTISNPKFAAPPIIKPFWDKANRGLQRVCWYCVSFVSALAWFFFVWIRDKKTEWRSNWVRLSFVAAAPIALPMLVVALAVMVVKDGRKTYDHVVRLSGSFWAKFTTACYRVHVLRRLPAPVLTPLALNVPTVRAPDVSASEPPTTDQVDPRPVPVTNGPLWYVFHPDILLGQKHLLAPDKLSVFPIDLKRPGKLKGIAVTHTDLGRFETVLGLDAQRAENEETDIERTVLRRYNASGSEVVIRDGDQIHAAFARRVLQAVCAKENMGVVVFARDCDDYSVAASVRIFTASRANYDFRRFNSLFGYESLDGRIYACNPSDDESRRDICDEAGNVAASVIEGAVHIYWSWFRYLDHDWAGEVLARILREAFAALAERSAKEVEDLESNSWRNALDANRDQYVRMCLVRLSEEQESLSRQIKECDSKINEAGKTINEQVRRRHALNQRLMHIQVDELDKEKENLAREFDQLAGAPCVTAVRAKNDRIEVDTRTVYMKHEGETYQIGRFTMFINNDGKVRFSSRDNTHNNTVRGGCLHPHIDSHGRPCLGNITETVATMTAQRQYAAVVNLLFRYLESYNPSSPYSNIRNWAKMPKEQS